MTKHIRIENADTSTFKVVVEVWEKYDGIPIKVKTVNLDYPTAMTDSSIYITSTRYLVVKEAPIDNEPTGK